MKFLELLSSGSYNESSIDIIHYILDHPKSLDELLDLYYSDNLRICQRASFPLTILSEKHPELLVPYFSEIYTQILNPPHDAALRNGLRFLHHQAIPEDLAGPLYDYCYKLLGNLKKPLSIRRYASVILFKIAQDYPELKEEMSTYFNDFKNTGSASFKSSMEKLISRLN